MFYIYSEVTKVNYSGKTCILFIIFKTVLLRLTARNMPYADRHFSYNGLSLPIKCKNTVCCSIAKYSDDHLVGTSNRRNGINRSQQANNRLTTLSCRLDNRSNLD